MRRYSSILLLGLILPSLAAIGTVPARAAPPSVVATIKPVHSLVASVMEGIAAPHLLIGGSASPHAYSMRPSDARKLQGAAVIFWVGPTLETFLEKPLKTLGRNARIVALEFAPGVKRLPVREGGLWEAHDHDHGHGKGGDDHHDHGKHDHDKHDHGKKAHGKDDHDKHDHGKKAAHDDEIDGHIWLDPRNAMAMVDVIASTLSAADPANASRYRANAAATRKRLATLEARIRRQLGPVRGRRYIVFHDAYQYFERRYGMTPVGSITVSPERAPGPRQLYTIRKKIVDAKVSCVFAEPQFPPRLVRTVISGTPARMGYLDPIGAKLAAGKDLYAQLQVNLATALVGCLTGK